ncbi:MAG: DUF2306 domain-containing protein [Alphaproteobacteria bacterium]
MKTISTHEWALLAFILVYSFVPTFGGFLRVIELGGGPAIIPENPRALTAPLPIVLHILSSFLFCIVGAVQFLPSLRRHYPVLHRTLGRTAAASGCVSAATGLWMTHVFVFPHELQGALLYWVRIGLSLAMIGLIVWAVIGVRSGNIISHAAAMLRAYAIGQGASTQAVLGIGWMIAFGAEAMGPMRDAMMVLAWALNLLIAELLISKMFASRPLPTY